MKMCSERLHFKKLVSSDAATYRNMATNEAVMKYITGRALEPKEARIRLNNMLEINKEIPEIGFYKVYQSKPNHFIGLGKLVLVENSTAEIGYSLLPEFWGKKYASEIAGFFINYASNIPYIKELIAVINPQNAASKKLLSNYKFTWLETGFINQQQAEIYKLILDKP
ncbi:MAG: GNAT family N-acetyltransferase [Ferruginibacter sp.]